MLSYKNKRPVALISPAISELKLQGHEHFTQGPRAP
jgi:hypothetical protein